MDPTVSTMGEFGSNVQRDRTLSCAVRTCDANVHAAMAREIKYAIE